MCCALLSIEFYKRYNSRKRLFLVGSYWRGGRKCLEMGGWKYTCFQVSNRLRSRTMNIHNKPRIKATVIQIGPVGLAAHWTILSRLLSLIRPQQRCPVLGLVVNDYLSKHSSVFGVIRIILLLPFELEPLLSEITDQTCLIFMRLRCLQRKSRERPDAAYVLQYVPFKEPVAFSQPGV